MEIKEILELVQAVSESGLTGLRYEENGVKLVLKKEKKTENSMLAGRDAAMAVPEACEDFNVKAASSEKQAVSEEAGVAACEKKPGKLISSPLVGTFYAAPAEDARAFVSVGDRVEKGQVLAIVEAMKLMNEIESEYDGTIAEILVKNGQMVEYGQPLFRVI